MQDIRQETAQPKSLLERIIKWDSILAALLIPIFFLPTASVNLSVAKTALFAIEVLVVFAAFLLYTLKLGKISIPKAKFLLPLSVLPLIAILSSVCSGSFTNSFFGVLLPTTSSGLTLMLVVLTLVISLSIRKLEDAMLFLKLFIASSSVVALSFIVSILGTYGLMPSKLFQYIPTVFAGNLVDASTVLGGAILLSLMALSHKKLSKRVQYFLYALIAVSVILVGAIDFSGIIALIAGFSLLYFIYIFVSSDPLHRKVSKISLAILVVSVILILGRNSFNHNLSNALHIQNFDVRPNPQATLEVGKQVWSKNPLLGGGPNRFSVLWEINKPNSINPTQFWASSFSNASSYLTTMFVETGLLGTVLLLLFLLSYAYFGVRALFAPTTYTSPDSKFVTSSLFFLSVYFWMSAIFYPVSIVVLALAFATVGLTVAAYTTLYVIPTREWSLLANPKVNFVSVFAIVVLVVLSAALGYVVVGRSYANILFQKASNQYSLDANVDNALVALSKSYTIYGNSLYLQNMANLTLVRLSTKLNELQSKKVTNLDTATKNEVQALISDALGSAQAAINSDKKDYINYTLLGKVYELLAYNSIPGALDNAKATYTEALKYSPYNPAIPLELARLDILGGDSKSAEAHIAESLALKPNYIDAYFTLAQMQVADKNIPAAIKSVESATLIDPSNAGLYFQLGLLKYDSKDFAGSVSSFERAVSLVPDYANAKYFLGLSYENIGKHIEAIKQFEDIAQSNPDNAEVKFILSNLKAGNSPFADAEPPLDTKPEKRTKPPVN